MQEAKRPKESYVTDEAGERIIRELPPGLYWVVGMQNRIVMIDQDHRARVYLYGPNGAHRDALPYRHHVMALARVAYERFHNAHMGWRHPDWHQTDDYEEARAVTPWAYRALERKPCG